MTLKVDEKTRVISNTEREKYLEMKSRRALLKRISTLEAAIEDFGSRIEALESQGKAN